MENFLVFLFKVAGSVSLFYLLYWLFLRSETFFKLNRVYLLAVLVFALILPLIDFSFNTVNTFDNYRMVLDAITITAANAGKSLSNSISIVQILSVIYFTGLVIFLVRFLFQIYRLSDITRKFEKYNNNGIKLVLTDSGYSPFSFFRLVFLNREIDKQEAEKIIAHEKIHIDQYHSLDVILSELFTIFQWFNPFAWQIRKSIREVHEFLADAGMLQCGLEKQLYQKLLLSVTMGNSVSSLTTNFNYSLLKRRFIMMSKAKSGNLGMLKFLFIIPVVIFLMFSLNAGKSDGSSSGLNNRLMHIALYNNPLIAISRPDATYANNDMKYIYADKPDTSVYTVVEQMPVFKGGNDALNRYILENIVYPKESKDKLTEGTVYVSFIVNQKGKVTKVKILRGVDHLLDAEALRVIKSMPDWTPGKQKGEVVSVAFTLPIKFRLEEKKK